MQTEQDIYTFFNTCSPKEKDILQKIIRKVNKEQIIQLPFNSFFVKKLEKNHIIFRLFFIRDNIYSFTFLPNHPFLLKKFKNSINKKGNFLLQDE